MLFGSLLSLFLHRSGAVLAINCPQSKGLTTCAERGNCARYQKQNCPIIGEQVVIIFVTQKVTIVTVLPIKTP